MFALLFRGFFLLGIISCYSMSVWKLIDGYFRTEYKRYLDDEIKRHPPLRSEETSATVPTTTQLPPTENEIIVDLKLAPIDADAMMMKKKCETSCNHEQDSCQLQADKKSEMDYDNNRWKQEMNDRRKISEEENEEEAQLTYWLNRNVKVTADNSNNNLFCDVTEEVNCSDN